MRITFWLSGVVFGTLLSTVCMANYLGTHPNSPLGRWVHPVTEVTVETEAEFAPPAVATESTEKAESASAPVSPVTPPMPESAVDDEEGEVLSAVQLLPPPSIPPLSETDGLFDVPFTVAVSVEALPIMPRLVEDENAVAEDEPVTVAPDSAGEVAEEVEYPWAIDMGDAIYDWVQDRIQDWICLFRGSDDEEGMHGEFSVNFQFDLEAGKCGLEFQLTTKNKVSPTEPPAAKEEPMPPEPENAEAVEFTFLPEYLPFPFGPAFPPATETEEATADIDCPPGHEAVCPFCGKWPGCDQLPTDVSVEGAEPEEAEATTIEFDGGCLDFDEFGDDITEDEPVYDLLYRIDGPTLL